MKIVKKIIFWFITGLLGLVLIFNLYNVFCLKVLNQKLPSLGGYAILEVVSGSMEPTIKIGDLIVIKKDNHDYQKGDIVTFTDVNGSFVTHRLVSLTKNEIVTKGDNNNTPDDAIPRKNIVGKYLFRIAGLGTLMASLKNPLVSLLIFVIGILICYLVSTDKEGEPLSEKEAQKMARYLAKKEAKENSWFDRMQAKIKLKLKPSKEKKKRVRKPKRKKGKKQNYKNKKRK